MPEAKRVQLPRVIAILIGIVALMGVMVMFVIPGLTLLEPTGTDVTNAAIRGSAMWPAVFWCFGWPIAFVKREMFLMVRIVWALGCLLLLLHVAVAFHLGHGWSHEAAREHTRRVGGYGDGIFVNYAFALVWFADAVWAWVSVRSYRSRPRWLHWTIHGFLAFVVLNAAVVFGSWQSRFLFVWCFTVIAVVRCPVRRKNSVKLNGGAAPDANPEPGEAPGDHR
jgi:hypothetical protein